MRPDPGLPPPLAFREAPSRALEVETITRVFGGGAKAKEVDARCWLRPPAAKSAIRSWWRAASAHRFGSLAELRAEEARLFGASATFDAAGRLQGGPGAVSIRVRALQSPAPIEYDIAMGDALGVAYFAGAPMGQPAARLMPPGARAEIRLGLAAEDDATAAAVLAGLRLWLTLGGAGARSRRGAGALALRNAAAARKLGIPADPEELKAFLAEHCRCAPVPPAMASVFSLARTRKVFLGPLLESGEEAQRRLLEALREARQDRPHPPSWRGPAGWGRTRWPEADAIRLLENRGPYLHPPNAANAGQYPRAALGLPMVVHYKHDPRTDPRPEPRNHTVFAALPGATKIERYASPILLRPVRVWRGSEARYAPVAIFTESTLPVGTSPSIAAGEVTSPVPGYDIQVHADATLARVEAAFVRAGFRSI